MLYENVKNERANREQSFEYDFSCVKRDYTM